MLARSLSSLTVCAVLVAGALQSVAAADETTISAKDRTSLNLTIYNGNLALIQDRRRLKLGSGISRIGFAGVSRTMMPSTAFLAVNPAKRVRI